MTKVADIMSTDVVTLTQEQELLLADEVMKLMRIRHLPVMQGDEIVGIVTARDLLRAQAELMLKLKVEGGGAYKAMRVGDIMSKDVKTLASGMPASLAAKQLLDNKHGCLPVTDGGKLVGIVTEADFLRWFVDHPRA